MLGAWTGFLNQIVVPEEWRENFRMSRVSLHIVYDSTCSVSKSSVFVPFSRIRVDARKRHESEYVWTRKVLNPQQNVWIQRIRIRVDGAIDIGDTDRRLGSKGVTILRSNMAMQAGKKAQENFLSS